MKKINITTIALLVYLIVMSIIGWPGNNSGNNYTEYFLMIGATLVIIILLRYLQVKRLRMRDKWKILPSNKNTACFSSQKNRLNELYFITLVLILLLFRPHRLLECLVKTTHSINYSIINKYNLNRTHTPLVSLTFLK